MIQVCEVCDAIADEASNEDSTFNINEVKDQDKDVTDRERL